MSRKSKRSQHAKGHCGARKEPPAIPEEESGCEASDGFMNLTEVQKALLEEVKKDFKNHIREVEEDLAKEMEGMQERVSSLEKVIQKLTEENNSFKNRIALVGKKSNSLKTTIGLMEKENHLLKNTIGQMEKEIQKLTDENHSLKVKLGQADAPAPDHPPARAAHAPFLKMKK